MVITLPSALARAKYEPDEPFVIILGCIPSDIARLTDWTKLFVINTYTPAAEGHGITSRSLLES